MITCDYHVHTSYCDGKNTPEEVVKSAIAKGMTEIGFSGHSYTSIDGTYCMTKEGTRKYIEEINALKVKYADKIKILCGLEKDLYSDDFETERFDYIIGSVHYIKSGDEYFSIDHTKDGFIDIAQNCFGGDYYSLAESYYESAGSLARIVQPDVIGHFDLITKFNEGGVLFDEANPRYVAAWKAAVDKLLPYNIPFEINTGAISRGYRTSPYPSDDILSYIDSKGGRFIFTSDSHSADSLLFAFDKASEKIKVKNVLKNI